MPSTYKTPGAYVEEIVKFPPSVASVETAIPAFIGYTEKAEKNGESLLRVPLKIDSFLEFEQYFGGPPSREIIIRINTNNQFIKTERKDDKKPYLLYDSLRLFFDNGGGICYIISVGDYSITPEIGDDKKGILSGLRAIEKYDEPTLILCPDAVNIDTGLYSFQQQALFQCNKLQDRFLICDLLKSDEKIAGQTHEDRIASFRDNIGINYLKYGAAYTPWLKTSLPLNLRFRDVMFAYETESSPDSTKSMALLSSSTNNSSIQQLLYDLDNSKKVSDKLKLNLNPGGPFVDAGVKDLRDQVKKLQTSFKTDFNNPVNTTIAGFAAKLQAICLKTRQIITEVKTVSDDLPAVVGTLPAPSNIQTVEFKLQTYIDTLKDQGMSFFNVLATHHKEIKVKTGNVSLLAAGAPLNNVISFLGYLPANLNNVPIDDAVHNQYRLLAAKKSVFDQLAGIAGNVALITAADVNSAVAGCIPTTFDNLKLKIETEIASAKAGAANAAAVATNLSNRQTAAPPVDKIAPSIAKSYVDEEILMGVTTVAGLPDVLPSSIYTEIFNDLMKLKKAAEVAAAVPGATKPNVVSAVTIDIAIEREYASFAADGAINVAGRAITYYESIQSTADVYETTFDQSLIQSFGLYKTLTSRAAQDMMVLPPSGGVAGVYASVDSDRGVWKAPANASLSSVLGPLVILNTQDQESLNVDANAGKSINAIRAFTGKGTLVWGSRTLAGNDNEWRYVPVRRFFNYAEESIKKATEPFVFEPNDINTWIRVKAMIENFLTLEWRRGALAGAKATDAFYVKVGFGETMNSLDILEGRMIVEVGMAVVRPAEFIILRFAHKMQES